MRDWLTRLNRFERRHWREIETAILAAVVLTVGLIVVGDLMARW